ncbi:hypothetical protein TUBRATIS_005190 [Tubulinosema ratisbonensis]|uniref:Uncharacterized protein n=1 Tax=Tubulinosema ratisbonensis TaxID=291195 RepID=A0A437AP54_9MICR|nr:hypothetical protein TUBRATIS_005190 [Tubulinosema ratisbonensis]
MRRSEEEVILMRRDINLLTNLIQNGFIGDNRGIFLYVIFLFFGKDVFNLDHSAFSSDTSASNPQTQSFPFDINEIQGSIDEWRKQKTEYATIKDAFDFLVQCKDKCDEKIVREHGDLFELRYKFKMLEGLVFFFDKTKK